MSSAKLSSGFTKTPTGGAPAGPPLIGALLRIPWETVRARMLARLHEQGFSDFDAAHLNVFLYPGPQGERPTELAARLGISRQALNYLLGQLERLDYLERLPDPDDQRSKRIAVLPRGRSAIQVIRNAVGEIEREWKTTLGATRFAQLRELLLELTSTEREQAES